jgi:hypothetical protein
MISFRLELYELLFMILSFSTVCNRETPLTSSVKVYSITIPML